MLKTTLSCFALALLLFAAGNSSATVFSLLTGDHTTINSDWSATENGIHYDAVTDGIPFAPVISTQHFVGNSSIGIQVPAGNTTNGTKQRFEYRLIQASSNTNAPGFQNARYCGFAFMLAGSPPLPITNSIIIWQGFQGSPWGPPAMLKFGNSRTAPFLLRLAVRNMVDGPCSCTSEFDLWTNSMINPNQWYSVEIYIKPCYDTNTTLPGYNTNGAISLWINGTNYVNWTGEIGYDTTKLYDTTNGDVTTDTNGSAGVYPGLDVKDGIYAPDPNNGHTVYFDELAVADSYEEACPVRPPTLTNLVATGNGPTMSVIGDTVANYAGDATANYTIEGSTNLTNWTTLANTNPASLPFTFMDSPGGTNFMEFYRVSVWPW